MSILIEMADKLAKKLKLDNGTNPTTDAFTERATTVIRDYARVPLKYLIVFALCFGLYLYLAIDILDTKHPGINHINIPHMKVRFDIHNNIISLEGICGFQVSFNNTNTVKAYPQFGHYVLSKRVNESQILRSISNTRYEISRNDQIIEVKFKHCQTLFQEDQTMAFKEVLNKGKTWVRVDGYFRMYLKLATFVPIPHVYRNLYFGCNIVFSGTSVPLEKIQFSKCLTSSKPLAVV